MATESTTTPSTLVEEWVERTRLSWVQVTVAVGLGVTLFLVVAAYLAGVLAGPFNADFWRSGMLFPGIIGYLLLIQPILRRLRDDAIDGCCPLVPMDDHDFHRLVGEASMFNRRREWLALGIGAVGGLLLWRPWDYYGPWRPWLLSVGRPAWLVLYALLSGGLMYGLLGWFIYSSLSGTRLFTELHRHAPDIDIFDLGSLEHIGRWSLGIALSYIGGITFSLLFLVPRFAPTIENIILYGTLTLAPVLVFFLNMMSTHHVMVEAKKRELSIVRENLAAASRALKEGAAKGQVEEMEALSDSITAWVAYERRVKEVPEWPYTESIIRTLVASLLLPVAIFTVQGVLVSLLLRLLSAP